MGQQNIQFLKLGGSLITDKTRPSSLRPQVLTRLAAEISEACSQSPGLNLILGHGSGSFGHIPAKKYRTRRGVNTPEDWRGFSEVWLQASALTRYVVEALHAAGLPAVAFPPFAGALADDGKVARWDLEPLRMALESGLVPVVRGDVAFDLTRGGTILSTEDVFTHLGRELRPDRILIAGIEPGVWADFPERTRILAEITPQSFSEAAARLEGSQAADVTGGMASKVARMMGLVEEIPGLEALIFDGVQPGRVREALLGAQPGTRVFAPGARRVS